MKPTLIEESTLDDVPHNLEVLVQHLSSPDKNDLTVILLYVLMIETGFEPQNVTNSYSGRDYCFNARVLNSFCELPTDWKNGQGYDISFSLGNLQTYPCKLLILLTADVLIVDLVVLNLDDERKTYSVVVDPTRYVRDIPSDSVVPSIFTHLKELSMKFKNSVCHPARSVILTKVGVLNSSLLGIPDELKIRILKYMKVCDLANVSIVCKDLYRVCQDQFLWRYFLIRDFNPSDLVNQPGINDIMIWKEEYKRRLTHNRPTQNRLRLRMEDLFG